MVEAAERAAARGVLAMVGFTYRRVPALALARQLVAEGRLGEIRHVRAQYLQDWIADPESPLVWRLQKDQAGSGALGDIGAHIVDLAQLITGERITGVTGLTETFVKERPLADGVRRRLLGAAASTAPARRGPVTVDDAAAVPRPVRRRGGRLFEATRFATGRKNAHADRGQRLARQPRLRLRGHERARASTTPTSRRATAGFRRILVTEPDAPLRRAWWPPGHVLGYEHAFTHEVVDLVTAIGARRPAAAVVRRRAAGAAACSTPSTRSAAAGSAWTPLEVL